MSQRLSAPELLMPAGSLEKLEFAYHFGADAVYAGVPFFSLRARENEFTYEDLEKGLQLARQKNKKLYLTANIFARNLKIKSFIENLDQWAQLKPDAMIMSDPGLMLIVRERHPQIPIHLSVQANCMNWQAVKFWQQQGIERVILSRELRLQEVKEIKQRVPDIELEAFVHGSICIAYSGRCLLSHYMSHRDANQGVCDNSCRYNYKLFSNKRELDEDFYLQDLRNPSEFYQIDEDENGTYIMNAKDLCVIEHLKELYDAGVCSFKVEGRTKSVFYAAMISKIYRQAIDDMMAGLEFNKDLLNELEMLAHRGYHKGFIAGATGAESQNYEGLQRAGNSTFVGVTHAQGVHAQKFEVKGQIKVGDQLWIYSPQSKKKVEVKSLYKSDLIPTQIVHPGMGLCEIHLSEIAPERSILCRDNGVKI